MLEPIQIKLQWPHRKDGVERCAEQLATSLLYLENVSPVFSNWARASRSVSKLFEAKALDPQDASMLVKLLLSGRYRKDDPRTEIIEDLGFSVVLLNRDAGGTNASYHVHCGNYAQNIPYNGVSVGIGQFNPPLLSADKFISMLKRLVEIWDANFGIIFHQSGPLSGHKTNYYLARFAVPGTDVNPHWPQVGRIAEKIHGGELNIDQQVRAMFDNGKFK